MEKSIQNVKEMIEKQVKFGSSYFFGEPFSEYQKFYYCTNENISEYLKLADFEGKNSALSVMASGDHVFNLITNGITNIDTFDTNKLTEFYVLGLRRAMILKYDYEEFRYVTISLLRSDQISIELMSDIINELLPYMDNRYRVFWKSIADFNYRIQKQYQTNINLFALITLRNLIRVEFNSFLISEDSYNLLKQRICSVNINFKCANAVDLASEFSGKYDFILLSNILDYFFQNWGPNWQYDKLREYENELRKIMNEDSIIFLQYIMKYGAKHDRDNFLCKHIFSNSRTYNSDLVDEEIHQISLPSGTNCFDGIVLKRVR